MKKRKEIEEEPELGDFTLTVEIIESRDDKVRGRNKFIPKVVSSSADSILTPEELLRIQ